MQIIIASFNPVKIQAIANAFSTVFPTINFTHRPVSVSSEVPDQPRSDSQTRKGAVNRVRHAQQHYPDADFWVGIEGGIQFHYTRTIAFAWIVIADSVITSSSRSATFCMPKEITEKLKLGIELGEVMDEMHHQSNSKQRQGAVGILSRGLITRREFYQHPVTLALIPFIDKYSP